MNREYPEEWELISFFGQGPDQSDKDEASARWRISNRFG